jgi:hypothetical protein
MDIVRGGINGLGDKSTEYRREGKGRLEGGDDPLQLHCHRSQQKLRSRDIGHVNDGLPDNARPDMETH